MKTIAIMQPTFIPWIGYFAMIDRVDGFVFLDSVQFARRSWQQRNLIKTCTGSQWVTMPVVNSGLRHQLIKDTRINVEGEPEKILVQTIHHNYAKAPYFKKYSEALFQEFFNERGNLCLLNINLIRLFMKFMSLEKTNIYRSSDIPVSGTKADLLVSICQYLKCENYLSAPGSRVYIEGSHAFEDAGIQVVYHDYKHPEYKQLFGEFIPYMSIVDLIFNEGEASLKILR